jgi:SOS response regulatory protein OraA/RecX
MKAKITALKLLSIKSRSCEELRKKLITKGFVASEVEAAIAECLRLGYLNDAEEAKRRARSLRSRGYGIRWIALKLKSQGLEPPQENIDEVAAIRALLEKPLWKKKERLKCMAALQRRGFSLESIFEGLKSRRGQGSEEME